MAEEKESAPQAVAPAPAAPAAPTPQQAAAPAAQAKKSNAGVIILVVVLVIVILGGGISYGIYRFIKNRVTNAVSDVVSNATGIDTNVSNAGKDLNDYSAVKDIAAPTDSIAKTANSVAKPILESLFGGAKLTLWSSVNEGGTLTYTTKNPVTSADYTKLENAFVNAGYTKDSNYNSSESFMVYFSKGTLSLIVLTSSSSDNQVSVSASQTATTGE